MLDRADEEVVEQLVVRQRRLGERLAAAPAADEVHEGVDAAEALAQVRRPPARGLRRRAGRRRGRRSDRRGARGRRAARRGAPGERSIPAIVAPAAASRWATDGAEAAAAPAIAITRPSRSFIAGIFPTGYSASSGAPDRLELLLELDVEEAAGTRRP